VIYVCLRTRSMFVTSIILWYNIAEIKATASAFCIGLIELV
jgi:hypothetical protein